VFAKIGRADQDGQFTDADRAVLDSSRASLGWSLGETGLDTTGTTEPGQQERSWHIDLAKRVGKQMMINRGRTTWLRILERKARAEVVVFHCFSGTPDRPAVRGAGRTVLRRHGHPFANATPFVRRAALVPTYQMLVETTALY